MAKSKMITVEEFLEAPLPQNVDPQLEADKQFILKIRKVTKMIRSEMDQCFGLYKKYVEPTAQDYCESCTATPNSIIRYYWKVCALDVNNLKPL
jgi:hypothetical protein